MGGGSGGAIHIALESAKIFSKSVKYCLACRPNFSLRTVCSPPHNPLTLAPPLTLIDISKYDSIFL